MNIVAVLRQADAYPKTLEDFRVKTFSGAIVTIISSVIMVLLFISEFRDYMTPRTHEELFVDTSRGSKLRINLDIVIPRVSCDLMSLDAMDITGEQHLQIDHNIFKRRLDLSGRPIEDPHKTDIMEVKTTPKTEKDNATIEECGSCYGAENPEKNITCCNTCEDVRKAYKEKQWAFPISGSVKQCENERFDEKSKRAMNEGCQIYGYMEVSRVAGSFHFSPGDSFTINHLHVHDVQSYESTQFNMSHTIRHLSFGRNIPGKTNPMDNTTQIAVEGGMMYNYYIKIVPTMYVREDGWEWETNQFSVTRHSKKFTSGSGVPGVFFNYELSPLMVKYSESNQSFGHFATNLCAIIGGVFTVAGLFDSFVYHSVRVIQKKQELGKFS